MVIEIKSGLEFEEQETQADRNIYLILNNRLERSKYEKISQAILNELNL